MASIQEKIDKMFEEKEKQDALIEKVVQERKNEFNTFLKQQKQRRIYSECKPPINYEKSIYYKCYQELLESLETMAIQDYYNIVATYYNNIIKYNDAFFGGTMNSRIISGIGFPIPDKYLNQITDIIKNKLCELPTIPECEFDVEIIPVEYLKTKDNNVLKPAYLYLLNTSLKKKRSKIKSK